MVFISKVYAQQNNRSLLDKKSGSNGNEAAKQLLKELVENE